MALVSSADPKRERSEGTPLARAVNVEFPVPFSTRSDHDHMSSDKFWRSIRGSTANTSYKTTYYSFSTGWSTVPIGRCGPFSACAAVFRWRWAETFRTMIPVMGVTGEGPPDGRLPGSDRDRRRAALSFCLPTRATARGGVRAGPAATRTNGDVYYFLPYDMTPLTLKQAYYDEDIRSQLRASRRQSR